MGTPYIVEDQNNAGCRQGLILIRADPSKLDIQ